MYVDSHCHLNMIDLDPYGGSLDEVLTQAQQYQVQSFLSVAVTLEDHAELVPIAEKFPNVYISVGVHPNEHPEQPLDMEKLLSYAQHPKVVAIGETGLDYFRSEGDLAWQRLRFEQHIECAKQSNKPLIIHTRQAKEHTLEILRATHANQVKGVMHCFTEDWATAKQALDMGFYISFSGIVTFKSAKEIQEVALQVPLDRMLIETDSPYLAPMPHRGKSNVPAYVAHVAEFIAQLRQEPLAKIAESTTENFFRLFQAAL